MEVGCGMQEGNRFVSSQSSSSEGFFFSFSSSSLGCSTFAASLRSPSFPSHISVQSFLFIASLVSAHDGVECAVPDMQHGKAGRLVWNCIEQCTEWGVNEESAPERAIRMRSRGRKGWGRVKEHEEPSGKVWGGSV